MPDESGRKIRDVLFLSQDAIEENVRQEMRGDAEASQTRLAWSFIGSEATKAVDSVLDKDIFEVVAEGWAAADILLAYADEKVHPRRERNTVPLMEHSFVKVLHPGPTSYGHRLCRVGLQPTAHPGRRLGPTFSPCRPPDTSASSIWSR